MIHVTTHNWGMKYGREYVDRLENGVRRHLGPDHKFIVITDNVAAKKYRQIAWEIPPEDRGLLSVPGCFARLRLFDPAWQEAHRIRPGDLIVSLDLDLIITGSLDALFARPELFVILAGANAANPCPFNGSVFMLAARAHADVWESFSLTAAARIPRHSFADDQGWLHHKMPRAGVWRVGRESGVYAFQKPGWPGGDTLPEGARIVAFPGKRDPGQFARLPWVREHWR